MPAGAITQVTPVPPLVGLNVSYSSAGRLQEWRRGPLRVAFVYDERSGQLVEKSYGTRHTYRFIYRAGGNAVSGQNDGH